MRLHRLLSLILCLSPISAIAQENTALCEELYRRLGNAPKVIGSTDEVRSHAQALTQQNIEIRKLRLDMRRYQCGSVSVTPLGGPNDAACRALRQMLSDMEGNRKDILSARNQARSLVISTHEAKLLRADIEANNCGPRQLDTVSVDPQEVPEEPVEPSITRPAKPGPSSIIEFNTPPPSPEQTKAAELPAVPERDYDPSQKVRVVGPRFFPNTSDIDLANPR